MEPQLDAPEKQTTDEVVEEEVKSDTSENASETENSDNTDKETPEKTEPEKKPETQAVEVEEEEEVKEPEVGSDGKIDAKDFEAFKKRSNAENKSLRERLRNLEKEKLMSDTGLTEAQFSFLKGETIEELKASAEAYKASLPQVENTTPEKTQPKAEPKKFSAPPKGSTIAANNGVSDIVATKDYDAVAKILNQKK